MNYIGSIKLCISFDYILIILSTILTVYIGVYYVLVIYTLSNIYIKLYIILNSLSYI